MIPTIEEFLETNRCFDELNNSHLKKVIIDFTKLHVEAFRREILKNGKIKEEFFSTEDTSLSSIKEIIANGGYGRYNIYGDVYGVDKVSIDRDSILNNYPLENIK